MKKTFTTPSCIYHMPNYLVNTFKMLFCYQASITKPMLMFYKPLQIGALPALNQLLYSSKFFSFFFYSEIFFLDFFELFTWLSAFTQPGIVLPFGKIIFCSPLFSNSYKGVEKASYSCVISFPIPPWLKYGQSSISSASIICFYIVKLAFWYLKNFSKFLPAGSRVVLNRHTSLESNEFLSPFFVFSCESWRRKLIT